MNSSEDIYKGNTASDYQPPTGNPQTSTTNLQPVTAGVQPSGTNGAVTQQALPSVDSLKVMILQDGSGSTNVHLSPVQTATQTWVGPFWGCVILAIIGIVIWSVKVLAKEEAPNLGEALEAAAKEPLLEAAAPVAATVAPKAKPAKQRSAAKKSTKKKSKRK